MPTDICRFADYELDPTAYQLRRKGRPVQLERIPLEVLFILADRPGQLVTREEILERVWGKGVFLDTDNAINTAVRKIRHALHDDSDSPRFVATVPAKGYRFVAEIRAPKTSRAEQFRARPPSGMVGRERELASLLSGLEEAPSRHRRLFLISGEPGVGKTRMADEVAAGADAKRMAIMVGHCSEHDEAVAYLPFVEILEDFVDRESNPDVLRAALGDQAPELARLIPKLKNILPELPPPLDLPPAQARRHLFNCFFDFVARIASERSTLMILEDLHWADDSTLSLLDHLTQRLSDLPLMVIGTYRDAEVNVTHELAKTLEDLLRGRLATRVRLKGLPRDGVAAMLDSLSGKSAPAVVVGEVFAETEGNPFFVEELFRHLEEENRLYDSSGQFRSKLQIAELDAPPTVRLVVARRLARLSDPTQRMLSTAAVIGRFFSFEILQASCDADADSILERVEEAEKAGVICSVAESPKLRFEFSHELIRQTVLAGLSAARRQRLHLEVAEAIERTCAAGSGSTFAGSLDDHITELAHHYAHSANTWQAVKYLHLAGERAAACCAMVEAERHYMTALKLLDELPETPERDRRELALQILLGSAAAAVKGIGAPERERSLLRARDLSQRLGEESQVFPVLWQLFHFNAQRGELQTAREYAEHALAVAESQCDAVMLAGARTALGVCLFYIGDFAGCRRQFELALAQDIPLQKRWYFGERGFDALAGALSALAEGILGYPDRCCVGVGEVVKRARTQSSLPDLAFALVACGRGHLLAGSPSSAQSLAEETITLSETYGYVERAAVGKCVRGVALTRQGELKEGIACILQGLSDYSATGGRLGQSEFYSALAAAFGQAGRTQEGLEAVDRGLAMGRDGGESFYRGELYRIRGELIQIEDPAHPDEVERLFRTAIDTASRQQAHSFELRATTSLARLLAKQGHRDEARTMLAEIYNWFAEGFDTSDLKDAKDLLDELDA
jgi:DNA-binding winged helix-turn-helix (wHTH) protein/tetratricopeptide (TPR) repeat protein